MNKILNFIGGLFLGTMAGALAGLLIAPKPGDQLRKELQQEIDDILAEAHRASAAKQDELEQDLSRLRSDDN